MAHNTGSRESAKKKCIKKLGEESAARRESRKTMRLRNNRDRRENKKKKWKEKRNACNIGNN